jgi:hypothetical protein
VSRERRDGDLKYGPCRIQASLNGRLAHALAAVRAPLDRDRPVHEPDVPVTHVEEMTRRKRPAAHVVDSDGIEGSCVAASVEEDDSSALLTGRFQIHGLVLNWSDEKSFGTMLIHDAQEARLLGRRFAGAPEHQDEACFAGHGFDSACDLSPERVGDVEDDHTDGTAPAASELPR